MKLVIHHKFGPMSGHYRVVRAMNMNVSLKAIDTIARHLNKVFGVPMVGKTIYPKIGRKYAVYVKEDMC